MSSNDPGFTPASQMLTVDSENHDEPDRKYWSKMPAWHPSEAAALLLNLDPDAFRCSSTSDVPEKQTPAWHHFQMTRLLSRACLIGELEDPVRPKFLIAWCKSNKIDVPSKLMRSLHRFPAVTNWRIIAERRNDKLKEIYSEAAQIISDAELRSDKDFVPKERRSVYTMLYVMAVSKYKYKHEINNHASKAIERDIEDREINIGGNKLASLDDETIRRHLKRAHNLLFGDADLDVDIEERQKS